MSVQITATNYNGQSANVTLFSSTGNTIPYTSANTISLGVQTIPFTYSSSTISNEYGHFSCNFTSFGNTCVINQQTPPDGDGNRYDIIKIGNQIWMSENLKTTKFQDGTPLGNNWFYPNGNSNNMNNYGLLYSQFVVTGSTSGATSNSTLCPSGWRVPTSTEFSTLNTFLGTGAREKAVSVTFTGTNSSGFNAYYAGEYRNPSYARFNEHAQFWTLQDTIYLLLANWLGGFAVNSSPITYGMSVRCLKN